MKLTLEENLKNLPQNPGVYIMRDLDSRVIYVGKAKNLKNRVLSYFKAKVFGKTALLVKEIENLEYVVCNTEQDALILEQNLIKEYRPKYNIRLIDDKTYPYIVVTDKPYTKLLVKRVRKFNFNGFGPFPNTFQARETCEVLNRIFPKRVGRISKTDQDILTGLANNLGIFDLEKEFTAKELTKAVKRVFQTKAKDILKTLTTKMKECAENSDFELALDFKNLIEAIKATIVEQTVNSNDSQNRDIIGLAFDEKYVAISILIQRFGKTVDQKRNIFEYVGVPKDYALQYLDQIYESRIYSDELLFSDNFQEEDFSTRFGKLAKIPKKGQKHDLTKLAQKNAESILTKFSAVYLEKSLILEKGLEELKSKIGFMPETIEAYDNAQIQGQAQVSGCIVLKNGQFLKSLYRKFNLKNAPKNDDLAGIKEVISRRIQDQEIAYLPDLIAVDGAENQVKAAEEQIRLLDKNIPVIGLKKNEHHRLAALVWNNSSHELDRHSYLYKFLIRISEEVHRFSYQTHKAKLLKTAFKTKLDNLTGISDAKKRTLIRHFGSVAKLKAASIEELKTFKLRLNQIRQIKELKEWTEPQS